jgi:hypothetical protein
MNTDNALPLSLHCLLTADPYASWQGKLLLLL